MNDEMRAQLAMAARVLEFTKTHPIDDPGFRAVVADLEANLARAAKIAMQEAVGGRAIVSGIKRRDHYILDVIVEGAETVDEMLALLNGPDDERPAARIGQDDLFTRDDVITALSRLILDASVHAMVLGLNGEKVQLEERKLPAELDKRAMFDVTPRGRVRHMNWDPYDGG